MSRVEPLQPAATRDRGRRQSVLGGFVLLLGSSYMDSLLSLVRGVIVMRIIGPTGLGMVRTVDLIGKYLTHSHLGALHGISKELPTALGGGDTDRATRVEDTGAAMVVVLGAMSCLALFVVALIWPALMPLSRQVLMLGAAVILCGQAWALYRVILRSWGCFRTLATASVMNTAGLFVLLIGGARLFTDAYGQPAFGAIGVMWGTLVVSVTVQWYLHRSSRIQVALRPDRAMARRLVLTGLPISAIIFADVLLRTADSMIVLNAWKFSAFGVYSVAVTISTYLYRLPETAGFVLMPRIWERYGQTSDIQAMRRQVIDPTVLASTLMPAVAGLTHIAVPLVITTVLPAFTDSIVAAQLLALGSVFLALPLAANGLLVALDRGLLVAGIKVLGAAIVAGGTTLAVWYGGYTQLRWVAMSAGAGYFATSLLLLWTVYRRYYPAPGALLRELCMLHLPFLWAIVSLYIARGAAGTLGAGAAGPWVETLIKAVVFAAAYSPLLYYGERRTGISGRLRSLATRRLGGGHRTSGSDGNGKQDA